MNSFFSKNNSDSGKNIFTEALFYTNENGKIRCGLCPHECLISEGKYGICKTRLNNEGKLVTIAYGNLCARNIDPIEKKPLYHFLPSSRAYSIAMEGCNFTCKNCQNWSISQSSPDIQKINNALPEDIVDDCLKHTCESIAYTYTEPVCSYEFVLATSKIAREKGIKNILISNGYINQKPLQNHIPFLDAANIDLKAFSNEIYKNICGAALQPVLNTLLMLKENKIWIEITNLIIPGINDDQKLIREMCDWLVENNFQDYPIHFSKFVPLFKLNHISATPLHTLEQAYNTASEAGMKYIYLGNVHGHSSENTFCPKCRKKIIGRSGYHIENIHIKNNTCAFCGEQIHGVWRNE